MVTPKAGADRTGGPAGKIAVTADRWVRDIWVAVVFEVVVVVVVVGGGGYRGSKAQGHGKVFGWGVDRGLLCAF